MRQVVLDTETTGLDPGRGHRIIEVGCIEMINRRQTGQHYHVYINPQRVIDEGAVAVHGITNEFVADKPVFADIADEFLAFIRGAELIIHNAPFDIGFMDAEFSRYNDSILRVRDMCSVIDTLLLARERHPGQPNNLDALCKRYTVDNSKRDWHGALVDADLLAQVYLLMTGGQVTLFGEEETAQATRLMPSALALQRKMASLPVILTSSDELAAHEAFMKKMGKA